LLNSKNQKPEGAISGEYGDDPIEWAGSRPIVLSLISNCGLCNCPYGYGNLSELPFVFQQGRTISRQLGGRRRFSHLTFCRKMKTNGSICGDKDIVDRE
jgi:hypothetical protein